jgi:hypothetical protein
VEYPPIDHKHWIHNFCSFYVKSQTFFHKHFWLCVLCCLVAGSLYNEPVQVFVWWKVLSPCSIVESLNTSVYSVQCTPVFLPPLYPPNLPFLYNFQYQMLWSSQSYELANPPFLVKPDCNGLTSYTVSVSAFVYKSLDLCWAIHSCFHRV